MPSDVISNNTTDIAIANGSHCICNSRNRAQDDSKLSALTSLVTIVWSLIANYCTNGEFIEAGTF